VTTPPAPPEGPESTSWPEPTARSHRTGRIIKWIAIGLVTVLIIGVGAVIGDYYYINSKIKTVATYIPKNERPAKAPIATKAENFLIIGSDTRQGANGIHTGGSSVPGARSDTTILMHISANDSGATLISIPRDSYVQIPACEIGPNGQMSQPTMGKFNEAFSIGEDAGPQYAPSCTVHTVETLTHIRIDHFVVVDFDGFKRIVDALHGVRVCVAHHLYDPVVHTADGTHGSNLNLPAGKNVLVDGDQALDLMRARYNLDGGGDLPRIKRQQVFVAAMIRKATSTGLLVHPLELQRFLVAAASSITTDGFGLGTMRKLADALHSVGPGGVRLLTVPNTLSAPGLPYGDVLWDPTLAPELWTAIRDDQPIPGTVKPHTSPSSAALVVSPSSISVAVENGTAKAGVAHALATELTAQGYHVVSVGNAAARDYPTTVVEYGPTKVQSSQTVAASIPGSVRQASTTSGTVITIIVGAHAQKVVPVTITGVTPTPTASIPTLNAAKASCLT
jgi:LCP family protein required for cell wall assembly